MGFMSNNPSQAAAKAREVNLLASDFRRTLENCLSTAVQGLLSDTNSNKQSHDLEAPTSFSK